MEGWLPLKHFVFTARFQRRGGVGNLAKVLRVPAAYGGAPPRRKHVGIPVHGGNLVKHQGRFRREGWVEGFEPSEHGVSHLARFLPFPQSAAGGLGVITDKQ